MTSSQKIYLGAIGLFFAGLIIDLVPQYVSAALVIASIGVAIWGRRTDTRQLTSVWPAVIGMGASALVGYGIGAVAF